MLLSLIVRFVTVFVSEVAFNYVTLRLNSWVQGKWKPFHTFALAGQIKFMDGLLEKGYDIEQVDKVWLFPHGRSSA